MQCVQITQVPAAQISLHWQVQFGPMRQNEKITILFYFCHYILSQKRDKNLTYYEILMWLIEFIDNNRKYYNEKNYGNFHGMLNNLFYLIFTFSQSNIGWNCFELFNIIEGRKYLWTTVVIKVDQCWTFCFHVCLYHRHA